MSEDTGRDTGANGRGIAGASAGENAGRKLYLLGHPIAHSKSPVMYTALFDRLGLGWRYGAADFAERVDAESFLAKRDFFAVNITTPYKPLAFAHATVKAATAKLAKGANVLVSKDDALIGFNVDGEGCVNYLERTGFAFAGAEVVVCGTGPTALSIVHACALAGASRVVLVGRNKERTGKALNGYVKEFGVLAYATMDMPALVDHHRSFREAYEQTDFAFGSYRSAKSVFQGADLVINATPLGMRADDPAPFDVGLLHAGQVVFDSVYGHGETALAEGVARVGARYLDGSGMLVAQAVASARIFTETAGVSVELSNDEMFAIMAAAAGFAC